MTVKTRLNIRLTTSHRTTAFSSRRRSGRPSRLCQAGRPPRGRQLVARDGWHVWNPAQDAINELGVRPPSPRLQVLHGEQRRRFFCYGGCDELIDRHVVAFRKFTHFAMQRIGQPKTQVAHSVSSIERQKVAGVTTLMPNAFAPAKPPKLWVTMVSHRAATASSNTNSSRGSRSAGRQRK